MTDPKHTDLSDTAAKADHLTDNFKKTGQADVRKGADTTDDVSKHMPKKDQENLDDVAHQKK